MNTVILIMIAFTVIFSITIILFLIYSIKSKSYLAYRQKLKAFEEKKERIEEDMKEDRAKFNKPLKHEQKTKDEASVFLNNDEIIKLVDVEEIEEILEQVVLHDLKPYSIIDESLRLKKATRKLRKEVLRPKLMIKLEETRQRQKLIKSLLEVIFALTLKKSDVNKVLNDRKEI